MNRHHMHNWLPSICLALVLGCLLLGCGGGSSGTGGQQFQGTIRSRTSEPLPGVTVTLIQSGESSVTDDNGYYSVTTDSVSGAVTYAFEAPGIQVQFTIEGVPGTASVVTVDFVLNDEDQSAAPTLVDIREDDANDSNSSGSNSSDDDHGSNSSQSSIGNSSSAGTSSDDDHGSSVSSDDDHESSSSVSSEDNHDSNSSESSESSSSSSGESGSQSSASSSSSSEDGHGGSGSGGSGGGGSSGSGGSSSSDD